ncbi:hypothetical protein ACTG9Q_09590 [Actinokineospora sp. 24-640]
MTLSTAVRAALAGVDPATVPLVVIATPDPGTDLSTPLLDGELCLSVVREVLADNGLLNAVPLGIATSDPVPAARAIMTAEALPRALAVTLDAPTAELLTLPLTHPRTCS